MERLGGKSGDKKATARTSLDDEMLSNCLRYAIKHNLRGKTPSAAQVANGANPLGEWDVSALARLACEGDAIVGPDARRMVDELQRENWRLRVQVRHLQGDRIGTLGKRTFATPTRRQSLAANRYSRRTLAKAEAHLYAIWEMVENDDDEWWCVEGFENFIFTLIRRGLPGSGARFSQRWVTKRLLELLNADPLCKTWMEKIRAQKKMWVPNEFNAAARKGHGGQSHWRSARPFMCRQMYRVSTLLNSKRESVSLGKLWTPMGAGFDAPVAEQDVGAPATREKARQRALQSIEREQTEAKLLRSKAEKDLAKREEETAAQMATDMISPLTSFERAGVALLLRNEPTKEAMPPNEDGEEQQPRKINIKKRRENAQRKWSQGGEAEEGDTRVFEGASVHHVVAVDTTQERSSPEALLGFAKFLVTEHEGFVDELHVAPASRGQAMSYHLLDRAVKDLELAERQQVRLQVDVKPCKFAGMDVKPCKFAGKSTCKFACKCNVAVHAYTQSSFVQWTPPTGGVWTSADEPKEGAMMMATDAGALAQAVEHRCRCRPLAPEIKMLHFVDGEEVDHVEVVQKTATTTRAERTDKERFAETYGTQNLSDPLALRLIGRSLWNVPICTMDGARPFCSNSSSAGFHLSCDAGNFTSKGIDRRLKQISVASVALKCWGVGGSRGAWGNAHVRHGMPLSQSCDTACVIRAWLGDDHAGNLERSLQPYISMMQSIRNTGIVVPHMYLQLPPTLYDANYNVVFRHKKSDNVWARFAVVGDTRFGMDGIFSADLACENEYFGVDYSLKKQSSWANEATHEEQSKIRIPVERPPGKSIRQLVKDVWPNNWEMMLPIALMMNDPSIDWSFATRKPPMEPKPPAPAPSAGQGVNRFPLAADRGRRAAAEGKGKKGKNGKGRAAPAPRDVECPEEERERLEMQWTSPALRDAGFEFDNFVSDLDGSADGAADQISDKTTIIALPVVDTFGERTSWPDMIGEDTSLARFFTAMCILHADMRIPENICGTFEARLRDRLSSGGSATAATAFNAAMTANLKIRHAIKVNQDTGKGGGAKECYAVTFDGTDSERLRTDWLWLKNADLEKCARTGVWPSFYFSALHAALVDVGESEDVINSLPAYASAALHYAIAMTEARKMPDELRPDPACAHDTFESESKLFIAEWIKLGFSLKAYGYHLWANLPTLFRRVGSLEGISQQGVEGIIGKLARLLPHLQLKPGGRFAKSIEHDHNAKLAETERRRANLDSPAQAIVEEFMLEGLEVTYGMTPRDRDALPLRDICARIDANIAAGRVIPHPQYKAYWQRYMIIETLRARGKGRAQVAWARAAGSGQYTELKKECSDYYSAAKLRYPVSTEHTHDEWNRISQKMRSDAWKEVGKPRAQATGKPGVFVRPPGQLAYQRLVRHAPPARPPSEV